VNRNSNKTQMRELRLKAWNEANILAGKCVKKLLRRELYKTTHRHNNTHARLLLLQICTRAHTLLISTLRRRLLSTTGSATHTRMREGGVLSRAIYLLVKSTAASCVGDDGDDDYAFLLMFLHKLRRTKTRTQWLKRVNFLIMATKAHTYTVRQVGRQTDTVGAVVFPNSLQIV